MSRSLTTAGVEVRSSSRTSTSTRNPRPTPGHPHSTRKSPISGANLILRVVHSNTSSRNEKSDILTSCLLVGGVLFRPLAIRRNVSPWSRGRCNTPCSKKAPSAIRCIKTDHTHASQHTTLSVRKHRAPNGALRLHTFRHGLVLSDNVRKHRAP